MSRIKNKAARLVEIEGLLIQHPEGLTHSDIAVRLGVDRSTISRNLRDLDAPVYDENGRLHIDRKGYLMNLRLSMHEALSLHLASRLLASNLDRQNSHAASALRKIAAATSQLAPQFSRHIARSADAIDEIAQFDNPSYMRILETLAEGWAMGCKVKVWYRKSLADPVSMYVISPYYIEPGSWGRSTYLIGLREPPAEIRTFKIERLVQAELLTEKYSVPAEFDPFQLLADAWGIWYTEEEPVEVSLKFSAAVAGRVMETRWHRSQQLEPQADGSLIWHGRVAALQEMRPWIRGWGANVQVLSPESLRAEMVREVKQLAEIYLSNAENEGEHHERALPDSLG